MTPAGITVFTFGYTGWGRDTETMVASIDDVEKRRGCNPPVFIDIRTSRSVRAVGFRSHKFEDLVGEDRYRWFRELGNANARSTDAYPIRLIKPSAVTDLLDYVLAQQERNRRSLVFCGCPHPKEDGKISCHRWVIGTRLLKEAGKRNEHITVEEWPGGAPIETALEVPEREMKAVEGGKKQVPVRTKSPAELVSLPWGSLLHICSSKASAYRLAGPAMHRHGESWNVPILWQNGNKGDPKPYRRRKQMIRKRLGVESRQV